MTRVLSTQTATDTIQQMRSTITGGVTDQIEQLINHGNTLAQPDVWDGALAVQFRSTWETTGRALRTTRDELERLRNQVERVNAGIMNAGGNA
jgi:uncharacterized protein YukE